MGHVSAAPVACRIGYVGWHTPPWILETTNLQGFLNKVKVLVFGLPCWRFAQRENPLGELQSYLCISSTYAYPPPPSLPFPPPPSPTTLDVDVLVGLTVTLLLPNPAGEQGPLHDNSQGGLHKQLGTMGQILFLSTKPREADSFSPGKQEDLLPSQIMLPLGPQKRNESTCIDNKASS